MTSGRWLFGIGLGITTSMMVTGGLVLADTYREAWQQAEQASNNLLLALDRDITRNIHVIDLSLHGATEALAEPTIGLASPTVRHEALFDRAASAEDLGSMLVLDAKGDLVEDSTSTVPHDLNLSDHDFFRVHRDQADVGLYVSRPFRSHLRDDELGIAISRRLPTADGRFAGIVEGTMHLSFFQHLFEQIDVGAHGTIGLVRTDGHILVRYPYREVDVDRDISSDSTFQHFTETATGRFMAKSPIDGIERLVTFRHLDDLPLILTVNMSAGEILAPWWRKTLIMGSILIALCGATATLSLLFRREMLRRAAAERALTISAERLADMASTDPLTGLANRRRFDVVLEERWHRARHEGTSLSLLLLDVDHFKAYNDRYGHQQGDVCLRVLAGAVQSAMWRPTDLVARYGGEEFVFVLPNTDERGAAGVAERIRSAIAQLALSHAGNVSCGSVVTASIGCATVQPAHEQDGLEALLAKADAHLYEAKRTGRDRVVSCMPTSAVDPLSAEGTQSLDLMLADEGVGALETSTSLDLLASLTAQLFRSRMAFVALVKRETTVIVGQHNVETRTALREAVHCARAVQGDGLPFTSDGQINARSPDDPSTKTAIGFCVGTPLVSPLDGCKLGALCVMDGQARPPLDGAEHRLLVDLAHLAVSQLEGRYAASHPDPAAPSTLVA